MISGKSDRRYLVAFLSETSGREKAKQGDDCQMDTGQSARGASDVRQTIHRRSFSSGDREEAGVLESRR